MAEPWDTVDPRHLSVLEELRPREPIFHTAAFGLTAADRERTMAPGYWEVGASGRRYSRAFILRHLAEHPPADAAASSWRCSAFGLLPLGPESWLLTYTLDQNGRLTRRATLWQRTARGWQILYHQGTLASPAEDDAAPGPAQS